MKNPSTKDLFVEIADDLKTIKNSILDLFMPIIMPIIKWLDRKLYGKGK